MLPFYLNKFNILENLWFHFSSPLSIIRAAKQCSQKVSIIITCGQLVRQPLERFLGGNDKHRPAGDLGLRGKICFHFLLIYSFVCFVEETRISLKDNNF